MPRAPPVREHAAYAFLALAFLPVLYNMHGSSWSINYATDNPQKPNCGGQPGGTVAIWTGGPTGADEDNPITVDGGRTPILTCVRFPSSIVNHVCSAHLVAADADGVRDRQTGDIKRETDPWISSGHAVFLGGDFNAGPNKVEMNKIYRLDGFGNYNEAAQLQTGVRGGQPTTDGPTGRKIDYFFFSRNHTPARNPGSLAIVSTESDHHMLIARAELT